MATMSFNSRLSLSPPIILLIIMSLVWVALLNNGIYCFSCLATLYALLYFSWRPNRPGIITLAFLTQWMQVVTFVIWMNFSDADIDFLSPHGGAAVICCCIGMVVMAAVVSKRLDSVKFPPIEELRRQALLINDKKILMLYIGATFFLSSLAFAFVNSGGFAQIILTLNTFKWIFFLVYGYVSLMKKKNTLILVLIILFEFGSGFYSYFSTFKEVILYVIIIALTFIRNVKMKQLFYSLLAFLSLGFVLLTWTAVKGDYRNYLNQGSRQQEVKVSKEEAFNKIGEQLGDLKWESYDMAIKSFLYRLQYVYHMALVMDRVPRVVPHEYGQLWWKNISFVLMPRLFFPNKPVFDASVKTNKYTGLQFGGFKEGASFSIPYYADGYIDFGYEGMWIPLFFLALMISGIYRFFMRQERVNILFRFAFVNVALFDFFSFESDGLLLFGRLMLLFLVFAVVVKTAMPALQRWVYK